MNVTKGGGIKSNNIFRYIKSIGYEIETADIVKFNIKQEDGKEILVNSTLTNEYADPNDENDEYFSIIDTGDLEFKITNDSAEDTYLNKELEEIADAVDCDETVFKLAIPKNKYLNQEEYDIKMLYEDELVNCEALSDVEWIITHYRPVTSPNMILETFFKSMLMLRNHLDELITIPNSHLLYLDEDDDFVEYENTNVNQTYVLPNTPVVYFNSIYTNTYYDELRSKNYDITQNLEIVVQMTFGCDILYVYRIMRALLSIDITPVNLQKIKDSLDRNPSNENIKLIDELIRDIENGENLDLQIITATLNAVKIMFETYNNTTRVPFPSNDITKKLQMYFFLIFYKLYIYLNFYLSDKKTSFLFKKVSSFMVRHTNYNLYLEIKKLLRELYPDKSSAEILKIIRKLIIPLDKNKSLRVVFIHENMNESIKERYMNPGSSRSSTNIGNPLYSILEYFLYFEKDGHEDKRDWLVKNNVDEKSAKYPLDDNTIIVEFRDFPTFLYMQLLIDGSDQVSDELLTVNKGGVTMKIINEFIGKKSKPKTKTKRRSNKHKSHSPYTRKTMKKTHASI